MTMSEINDDQHCEIDLPEELFVTHILLRLPIKTLIRLKSVSKRWNSIISSPDFARLEYKKTAFADKHQHLLINHGSCFLSLDYACYEGGGRIKTKNLPLDDREGSARILKSSFHDRHPRIFIMGSCDGLVCLVDPTTSPHVLYLWNPTTLEHRQIPYPEPSNEHHVVWGFGYVSSIDDYNIVRICSNRDNNEKKIQVFSVKDYSWTSSREEFNGYGYGLTRLTGSGVTVDDVTYWTIHKAYVRNYEDDGFIEDYGWFIIGFDLVAKKLIKVPLPHWLSRAFEREPLISVREGCLCACWPSDYKVLDIGILNQCRGMRSWAKLFSINHDYLAYAMTSGHRDMPGVTNKGRFVFHVPKETRWFRGVVRKEILMLVDPEQEPPENVHRLKIPKCRNLVNYIRTLISPYYGSIELTKRSQRVEKKD